MSKTFDNKRSLSFLPLDLKSGLHDYKCIYNSTSLNLNYRQINDGI